MRSIERVEIVVPAHNEADLIGDCLAAIAQATAHPRLDHIEVELLVVLDACTDDTARRCADHAAPTLSVQFHNVGRARRAGIAALITTGHLRKQPAAHRTWIAMTDADTRVAPDWLSQQLRLADSGADATFGVVDVDDWSAHPATTRRTFTSIYTGTAPNIRAPHPHVHGANLGVRASAYHRVGGIPALAVGEDQAFAALLTADRSINVAPTTEVRATTSARRNPRARGGFGDLLATLSFE